MRGLQEMTTMRGLQEMTTMRVLQEMTTMAVTGASVRARACSTAVVQLRPELALVVNTRLNSESWPRAGNPGRNLRKTDYTDASILVPRLVC